MDPTPVIARLRAVLREQAVQTDRSMKELTTFRIGGPCDLLVLPQNESEGVECIRTLRDFGYPYVVLGNGSNVLVHDEGIRGCVVKFSHKGDEVTVDNQNHTIYVGAGEGMMRVAYHAIRHGLGGMEFASGIPGTLGGTVFMNAGAYGHEMKDVVQSVRVLTQQGDVREIGNAEMFFSYRHSAAQDNGWMILGATLRLYPESPETIEQKVSDFWRRRSEKQPLHLPSAGSAFKRPEGHYAAKLIDDAGLKGASVGDAEVSFQHAGFIVNRRNASCADVMALMDHIEQTVFERFGVMLRPEIKLLGPTL
jgi:UDP-N-acetylmuramate dehydrogenase